MKRFFVFLHLYWLNRNSSCELHFKVIILKIVYFVFTSATTPLYQNHTMSFKKRKYDLDFLLKKTVLFRNLLLQYIRSETDKLRSKYFFVIWAEVFETKWLKVEKSDCIHMGHKIKLHLVWFLVMEKQNDAIVWYK